MAISTSLGLPRMRGDPPSPKAVTRYLLRSTACAGILLYLDTLALLVYRMRGIHRFDLCYSLRSEVYACAGIHPSGRAYHEHSTVYPACGIHRSTRMSGRHSVYPHARDPPGSKKNMGKSEVTPACAGSTFSLPYRNSNTYVYPACADPPVLRCMAR